jgi:hypothetical protein
MRRYEIIVAGEHIMAYDYRFNFWGTLLTIETADQRLLCFGIGAGVRVEILSLG